ncbi:50S ribosomal protein L30 [Actinomycetaceae bacterium WB03_NA08]|uniref:Large ribosomal subunit protein uL30 n=1 Tax=Scrofimicrobium canadense TaxID=2652290 RepID=A0A6N7W6D8_9ACTO|nr:50S ribosomal protein L30 [Scrofimicrobium canadense]MSS83796.1 50S ribosomal protein L30 [Scrofimicrobium canadense]
MADLKITLKKSPIGAKQNMKDTLRNLGLRKIGQTTVRPNNDAVKGMVRTVRHLVDVEEA